MKKGLIKMGFHPTLNSVLWTLLSFVFIAISLWALVVFREAIRNTKDTKESLRKRYSLYDAWDEYWDEMGRMSQHVVSFFLGFLSMFIDFPPAKEVPTPVMLYGTIFLFVLFYINLASGINSIRAVRHQRWKRAYIRDNYPAIIKEGRQDDVR